MEEWRIIRDFPHYSVSNQGRVRNEERGRLMAISRNQKGILNVGLVDEGIQRKRSVSLLVATHFLKPHKLEAFNSAIHLDGDKSNCRVENLMWRPRWFAVKFQQQFENPGIGIQGPIQDINTKVRYESSMDACMVHGLLNKEVAIAIYNSTYVWPTYQTFRRIE